jgi:hypothetical protein
MAIHRIENVTPETLQTGLDKLRDSGFTVEGNRVSGMGIEAAFEHVGNVLTVNVEKAPPFLGSMIENQLRTFFR